MELIVQLNMRVSYIITTHYYYFIVCIIYIRNKENILMAFVKYVWPNWQQKQPLKYLRFNKNKDALTQKYVS